jgi:hypothetical protein
MFVFSMGVLSGQDKNTVMYNFYSPEVDSPMWIKDLLSTDAKDEKYLHDRQKAVASQLRVGEERSVVSNVTKIANAFNEAFEEGIKKLEEATNNIAKTGITIGLKFPFEPSATRTAIEGYIVSNAYDEANNTDIYLIHFTQDLKVQPNVVFPYIMDGGLTTNNITGVFKDRRYDNSNWTNVYRAVERDIEYNNCHLCYVQRPEQLRQITVWTQPHLKWGSATSGIDYGNIVHLAFGENLFTGILRDFETQKFIEIKDGAIMGDGVQSYIEGTPPVIDSISITESENENKLSPNALVSISGTNFLNSVVEVCSGAYSSTTILNTYETVRTADLTVTETQIVFRASGKWADNAHSKVRIIVASPYGAAYSDIEGLYTKGE